MAGLVKMLNLNRTYKDRVNTLCAYRHLVEDFYGKGYDVPESLSECENCSGYPVKKGCINYTTLDHLIDFDKLRLK